MPPDKLLTLLKKIEHETGFRSKRKWGERHLDIDILSYHDLTLKTENLTIPHTEITNRSFVLVPLFEVAGNIILAGDNKPLSFYLEKIDISGIKEYKARENKSASFT
jgi:2-amino-4-hydroxy-6-hydroxymethyldihydropteridine diphosphokinase